MRNAWCHLFHFARYTVGAGFTSAATRFRLGFAGTGAGARLAAIVQPILIAQLILRVEAIPIVQTILVLLARLIGGRQRQTVPQSVFSYGDAELAR